MGAEANKEPTIATKMIAVPKSGCNKIKKVIRTIIKGKDFKVKDGQILYVKLYKPIKVNIVTGEVVN